MPALVARKSGRWDYNMLVEKHHFGDKFNDTAM
jgi:hypothetical protein